MKKFIKQNKSRISTWLGLCVAVAQAWLTVDWSTFALDYRHLMPLALSAAVAIGGYKTSLNIKEKSNSIYDETKAS